jgi:hypothetical protein
MRDTPRTPEPEVGTVQADARPLEPVRARGHLLRRSLRSAAYLGAAIAALAAGGAFAGTRGLVVGGVLIVVATPVAGFAFIPEGRRDHTTPAETLRLHGLD